VSALVNVVVLVGMGVVVPVGLRLVGGGYRWFARVWPVGAVPAGR
jgi:hypothetical protein